MNNLVKEIAVSFNLNEMKDIINDAKNNILLRKMQGFSIQHRQNVHEPWNFVDGLEKLSIYKDTKEKDFSVINNKFLNTEFSSIIGKFNLYRSRILFMKEKSNYSLHSDLTWRLHIPIFSNKECFFYFPQHEKSFTLKEGKIYIVNTTETHTFINCSGKDRVHFVASIDIEDFSI